MNSPDAVVYNRKWKTLLVQHYINQIETKLHSSPKIAPSLIFATQGSTEITHTYTHTKPNEFLWTAVCILQNHAFVPNSYTLWWQEVVIKFRQDSVRCVYSHISESGRGLSTFDVVIVATTDADKTWVYSLPVGFRWMKIPDGGERQCGPVQRPEVLL